MSLVGGGFGRLRDYAALAIAIAGLRLGRFDPSILGNSNRNTALGLSGLGLGNGGIATAYGVLAAPC